MLAILTYLFGQSIHLSRCKSSVGKHSNLACNVIPVTLAAKLFKVLLEKSSHSNDSISHSLDFSEPLFVEIGVIQKSRCNSCSMNRWVGIHWSHENLDLRVYAFLLLSWLTNNRECTSAFTIQTLLLIRDIYLHHQDTSLPCSLQTIEQGKDCVLP